MSDARPLADGHAILVAGGGRWARTILKVLDSIVSAESTFYILTRKNSEGMRRWVTDSMNFREAKVLTELPTRTNEKISGAVVVNAAADHFETAEQLIRAGAKVLVEKPLAMDADSVRKLETLSAECGGLLAAASVFRFTPYLPRFAGKCLSGSRIDSVSIVWEDSKSEFRYGDYKSYDASIPVFVDVLPHVFSILASFVTVENVEFQTLDIHAGGSVVELYFCVGVVKVHTTLSRNSRNRRRIVNVIRQDNSALEIDFSVEPGVIRMGNTEFTACDDWHVQPKPLENMLATFIDWINHGAWDHRLSTSLAYEASALMDLIMPQYDAALSTWLSRRMSGPSFMSRREREGLTYALTEMSQRFSR